MEATVEATMKESFETLITLARQREEEIIRLNNAPSTRSIVQYEAVDDSNPAVAAMNLIRSGKSAAPYVAAGLVTKIVTKGEKTESGLAGIDKNIRTTLDTLRQTMFAQKPAKGARSSGSSGGSHAITKAWFDAHKNECPAGMAVAWDDTQSKITYNLPKGGRGATVSHGALNNILKAFGGRVSGEVKHDESEQPNEEKNDGSGDVKGIKTPKTPKKVPAKKAGKK